MKAGITIGLQPGTRVLRIVRHPELHAWDVWIAGGSAPDRGTFLRMHDNGMCERIFVDGEAVYEQFVVKPKDEDEPG